MTRDTDVFIPLEERTAIANREGADLFLSIHANASRNPQARGIETYFLNFAIEPGGRSGRRARERGLGPDDAQPAGHRQSHRAEQQDRTSRATSPRPCSNRWSQRLGTRSKQLQDLGVKQAPFVVLIGAACRACSPRSRSSRNKQDGALLKTGRVPPADRRRRSSTAIVDYQQRLKRMNAVASKRATRAVGCAGVEPAERRGARMGVVTLLQALPQPIIVRVVEQPVHDTSIADVIVGAIGLHGICCCSRAALLGRAARRGVLIGVKRLRAPRQPRAASSDSDVLTHVADRPPEPCDSI